jgi:CheY-like chemotaxis protein
MERSQGGLGIGLTLVKKLIEMHDGTIQVSSGGLGKGSEFSVRLPLVTVAKPEPLAVPANLYSETKMRRRIMVVDDNLDSADSLSMMLELLGHEVSAAHDGVEAVETARSFRPDVAFLDVGMPRMNGYEAARLIRLQPECAGVILVALTGWGQEEDKRRSHEAGFDVHMVKPIDYNAVEKLISDLRRPDFKESVTR